MEELFTFEGHIRMSVLPSGLWTIGLADEAVIAADCAIAGSPGSSGSLMVPRADRATWYVW